MEFSQVLLNPGTQLDPSSSISKSLESSLFLILSQIKTKLTELAGSRKFDFRLSEFGISEKERFIGAMVTQFTSKSQTDKNSLGHFVQHISDFLVCLKSDGIRYLLALTNKRGAYFIDRMNNIFEVKVDIGEALFDPLNSEETKIEYLLDGELIFNKTGMLPREELHFHLFDCLVYKRSLVVDRNYLERIECCQSLISESKFIQSMLVNNFSPENKNCIFLYVKDFFEAKSTRFLLEKLGELAIFRDKIDGLVFTKISYPYYPGRNQGIIKWKPDNLNTIDFLLLENHSFSKKSPLLFENDDFFVFELYCSYRGQMLLFDYLFLFDADNYIDLRKEFKTIVLPEKTIEGAIIECGYDKLQRQEKLDKFYQFYFELDFEVIQGLVKDSALGSALGEDSTAINTLLSSLQKRAEQEEEVRGNWTVLRVRTDKTFPNGFITAKNVFNSIFEDNITQKVLLKKIEEGLELQGGFKEKKNKNNF